MLLFTGAVSQILGMFHLREVYFAIAAFPNKVLELVSRDWDVSLFELPVDLLLVLSRIQDCH